MPWYSRWTASSSSGPAVSAVASDATSAGPSPPSGTSSRFSTLDQHPLRRLVQAVAGPAVDHDGDDRVDRQPPQHERQRLRRLAVGPLQIIDHDRHRPGGLLLSTTSSSRAPTANDEAAGPAPPAAAGPPGCRLWPPVAAGRRHRSPDRPRPGRRGPTAPSGRVALARQRRARAVFPTPGSPSMATSHGCPASTWVMTSATCASSAARPTKTSSGGCRSCTHPPHSRPCRGKPVAQANPDHTSVTAWGAVLGRRTREFL